MEDIEDIIVDLNSMKPLTGMQKDFARVMFWHAGSSLTSRRSFKARNVPIICTEKNLVTADSHELIRLKITVPEKPTLITFCLASNLMTGHIFPRSIQAIPSSIDSSLMIIKYGCWKPKYFEMKQTSFGLLYRPAP